MRYSEKLIEKKLRERIKKMGGLALKLESQHFTGLPDRLILMPKGKIYFVETKSTGDKPRKRQLLVHEQLRGLGFSVDVIDDLKGLERFYEKITK